MQQIQPVQIWTNGVSKTAEFLDAKGLNVILGFSAGFWYGLYTKVVDEEGNDVAGEVIASGNLEMIGDDYLDWKADSFAWEWVASQLNLVIL